MPQDEHITRDERVAVGAAIHVLQAGAFIEIAHAGRRMALIAAEMVMADDLLLQRCRTHGQLVRSWRLNRLEDILGLFDGEPLLRLEQRVAGQDPNVYGLAEAAVDALKWSGFLPLGVLLPIAELPKAPLISIAAAVVERFPDALARSLEIASSALVPLQDADTTRFLVFRSRLGGPQHFAVIVGEPDLSAEPLCRLHSECFTGDVFGSLRCDCGEQLSGATRRMAAQGGGILLYLSQEGRGIGLVNKLRAYRLQDDGVDTVDANTRLGFEPDERNFACAAAMLGLLGVSRVRLMTNNPGKLDALTAHGIAVTDRIAHSFKANDHNHFYLETKARRSGHLLEVSKHGHGKGNGAAAT